MNNEISFEDLLKQELENDDFREDWERTLLARSVANQVIRYRVERHLSQRDLATKLGTSQAIVGRLELGEHEPKLSTLSRLARILGLRFTIAIHPIDSVESAEEVVVSKIASGGVELIVAAG
jgi:transcriptional regulator with XRE-family HTH domain